jgi:F-type H+-transporting ATPase subunit gamma
VELVYSEFKNAATQRFKVERFLPIPKVEVPEGVKAKKADFIFEPDKDTLVAELMPKILNTQLYKAVLDAHASEHGARMTAMDKATENANELLKSLKISYNRARQAAITTELTEIVKWCSSFERISCEQVNLAVIPTSINFPVAHYIIIFHHGIIANHTPY